MRRLFLAALLGAAFFMFPAAALAEDGADEPDDSGAVATSSWAICHDGILSDDIGQNCPNDAAYGPPYYYGGATPTAAPAYHAQRTYAPAAAPVVSSGGYCGAYQFDQSTWSSVGMSGSPCGASPALQDQAAQRLYAQRGSEPWPTCGRFIPDWAALRMCENSGSYAP